MARTNGVAFTAQELAQAFVASVGFFSAADGERIESTVLCAGQHVFDVSGPGHWEAFDAELFDRQMPMRGRNREQLYFDLVGFFGWLGVSEVISPDDAIAILRDLERVAPPCPPREGFTAQTIASLESD